uniref:(northern house mosquito) hypothetical protein n=1 Tax=Culex pipiens TaxID=7175 RepID=A0A8D8HM59_CULPI
MAKTMTARKIHDFPLLKAAKSITVVKVAKEMFQTCYLGITHRITHTSALNAAWLEVNVCTSTCAIVDSTGNVTTCFTGEPCGAQQDIQWNASCHRLTAMGCGPRGFFPSPGTSSQVREVFRQVCSEISTFPTRSTTF